MAFVMLTLWLRSLYGLLELESWNPWCRCAVEICELQNFGKKRMFATRGASLLLYAIYIWLEYGKLTRGACLRQNWSLKSGPIYDVNGYEQVRTG